eukprot:COSAG02_NODE_33240_length_503_cov_0.913366_1_plen_32_part_01
MFHTGVEPPLHILSHPMPWVQLGDADMFVQQP